MHLVRWERMAGQPEAKMEVENVDRILILSKHRTDKRRWALNNELHLTGMYWDGTLSERAILVQSEGRREWRHYGSSFVH